MVWRRQLRVRRPWGRPPLLWMFDVSRRLPRVRRPRGLRRARWRRGGSASVAPASRAAGCPVVPLEVVAGAALRACGSAPELWFRCQQFPRGRARRRRTSGVRKLASYHRCSAARTTVVLTTGIGQSQHVAPVGFASGLLLSCQQRTHCGTFRLTPICLELAIEIMWEFCGLNLFPLCCRRLFGKGPSGSRRWAMQGAASQSRCCAQVDRLPRARRWSCVGVFHSATGRLSRAAVGPYCGGAGQRRRRSALPINDLADGPGRVPRRRAGAAHELTGYHERGAGRASESFTLPLVV